MILLKLGVQLLVFCVLVVESVFTWEIESFVDLCFDVVSFVTALTEKFQKFICALFKIVIGGADMANSECKAACMGLTFYVVGAAR